MFVRFLIKLVEAAYFHRGIGCDELEPRQFDG